MTLQNNRIPVPCYVKLCALFYCHQWIQTGVTFWKRSIRVKIRDFFFVLCELEIWKIIEHISYASFHSHWWFQTWVTVRKHPIRVKICYFFVPRDPEIWRMTSKHKRAPLLGNWKLCVSFRSHVWIQTGVTVQKHPNWGKICFDPCDLDLWPWLLAWTSFLSMVITPKNFMTIRWEEHCEKGVTDGQTDGRTDGCKCS